MNLPLPHVVTAPSPTSWAWKYWPPLAQDSAVDHTTVNQREGESLADSHCLPELRTRPRSVPTHKSMLLSQVRTLRNTSVKLPDWLHTLEQFLYRSSKQTASGIQNFSRHYSRGQRPIQLSCEDACPTVGGKTHLKLLKCVTQTPFKSKLCYKTHKMNFIPLSLKYTLQFC